jgi:hypothetical protein
MEQNKKKARRHMSRIRLGAAALGLSGIMFVLYPALRPWHDESTVAGATASMGSSAWVLSHFFGMLGFILAALGLLAVRSVVQSTRSEPLAAGAVVATWIGAGLTLPYYGAEDFGLHAAATWGVPDLPSYAEAVRYTPLAVTIFGTGLILLAIGAILAAVAIWRAGANGLTKTGALLYAAGMALFLPQFFTPAGVRIVHGAVLGIGAILLAAGTAGAAGLAKAGAEARGIEERRAGIMTR